MTINQHTKISAILKHHPDTLEAIVSISPKFEKLRNPVLRKLMAGRTTIAMASKIGGCTPADFFAKLLPLGFEMDDTQIIEDVVPAVPAFIQSLQDEQVVTLDVRPVIAGGQDPLSLILQQIKTIQTGQVLKIINTFEPTPLRILLQKQGFDSYAAHIHEQLVETWFYKTANLQPPVAPTGNWDDALARFKDKLQTIDVRSLEMPRPMMAILEHLDQLPPQTALFVYHKRIPVFLLPELAQRKLEYRTKEISPEEVHLLIFKDQ